MSKDFTARINPNSDRAAAWLALATSIDLSYTEAALIIGTLIIYQITGEAS